MYALCASVKIVNCQYPRVCAYVRVYLSMRYTYNKGVPRIVPCLFPEHGENGCCASDDTDELITDLGGRVGG